MENNDFEEFKTLQQQIEEEETQILLELNKIDKANRISKLYSKEIQQYKNPKEQSQLKETNTLLQKQLKVLQSEEKELQTQLLPYVKYKTYPTDVDPEEFYDMIAHCNSILQLLVEGWKIQINKKYSGKIQSKRDKLIRKFNIPSYQLGILGNANMGKSFFISLFCKEKLKKKGINTPTGMTVSTQGLSVIRYKLEKDRILDILDSQGFSSAIQYEFDKIQKKLKKRSKQEQELEELQRIVDEKFKSLSPEEQKQIEDLEENAELTNLNQEDFIEKLEALTKAQNQQIQTIENDLEKRQKLFNDRQISEKLIQQFITKSSSMIIIVVGDLTSNEQKLIDQVTSMEQKKPIIIIHNLYKIQTLEEFYAKYQINIDQSFPVIECNYYNGLKYFQGIENINGIVKFREIFHIPFGFSSDDQLMKVLAKTSKQDYEEYTKINKWNAQVLQFIQDKVHFHYANLSTLQTRSLTQSLIEHFQQNITDYLDLIFDNANEYVRNNQKEFKDKFYQLSFTLQEDFEANQSLLYSKELLQLNQQKIVQLKNFNFDGNNQIVVESHKQIIRPNHSLLINRDEKIISIYLEMPPINSNDIERIKQSIRIWKNEEYFIFSIRNFNRDKNHLCDLFNIEQKDSLKPGKLQARDNSKQYKIEGTVEIDLNLCQVRSNKLQTEKIKIEVTDGGVVRFQIPYTEIQHNYNQFEDYEDLEEHIIE